MEEHFPKSKLTYFKIENESSKHKVEYSEDNGGETHFNLDIVTDEFKGLSDTERKQLIQSVLSGVINDSGIKQLYIFPKTNEEYKKNKVFGREKIED